MDIQGAGKPEGIKDIKGAAASNKPSDAKVSKGFSDPSAQVVGHDKSSTGRVLAQGTSSATPSLVQNSEGKYTGNVEGIGEIEICPEGLQSFYERIQDAGRQQDVQGVILAGKISRDSSSGRYNRDALSAVSSAHLAV